MSFGFDFDFDFEIGIVCDPAHLYHRVSQLVQPRLFLMTEVPECSLSLTTRRREGAGQEGGKEVEGLLEARPLSLPLTPK